MELTVPLEIKAVGEAGEFSGFASVYNTVDLGGDLVEPGAFSKSLSEQGAARPLLWSHNTAEPIGQVNLSDTREGLRVTGKIALDVSRGKEIYSLLKQGIVRGLSIGYRTVQEKVLDGVRHLRELKLFEVSLVTLPMCEAALVTSVKSITTIRDLEAVLHQAGLSRAQACRVAAHGFKGLGMPDEPDEDTELLRWLREQRAR